MLGLLGRRDVIRRYVLSVVALPFGDGDETRCLLKSQEVKLASPTLVIHLIGHLPSLPMFWYPYVQYKQDSTSFNQNIQARVGLIQQHLPQPIRHGEVVVDDVDEPIPIPDVFQKLCRRRTRRIYMAPLSPDAKRFFGPSAEGNCFDHCWCDDSVVLSVYVMKI